MPTLLSVEVRTRFSALNWSKCVFLCACVCVFVCLSFCLCVHACMRVCFHSCLCFTRSWLYLYLHWAVSGAVSGEWWAHLTVTWHATAVWSGQPLAGQPCHHQQMCHGLHGEIPLSHKLLIKLPRSFYHSFFPPSTSTCCLFSFSFLTNRNMFKYWALV